MRDIPVLQRYYQTHDTVPANIALGFAAYLLFMKGVKLEGDKYYGSLAGQFYPINDDKAAYFYELWQLHSPEKLVDAVLQDEELWGADLSQLNGFGNAVKEHLNGLIANGAVATLESVQSRSIV